MDNEPKKKESFTLLFLTRKSRKLKDGKVNILIRLTIDNKRVEWSSRLKVTFSIWNQDARRAAGRSSEAETLNKQLKAIEERMDQAYTDLLKSGEEITVDNLYSYYSDEKGLNKTHTLIALFDKKIEQKGKMLGVKNGITPSTYKKYIFTRNRIETFLLSKNDPHLTINRVDYTFIKEYELFLRTKSNCAHNAAMKHLWYLRQITSDALHAGLISKDPFYNIQLPYKKVDREFLEDYEIGKLISKEFPLKRLDRIRDIFLFCCYTGLAYTDVKSLSKKHIIQDSTGRNWIKINRQKTNVESNIPLFDIPEMILKKYQVADNKTKDQTETNLLPVLSNQKMNAYLKEIATICGIPKDLTTHMRRHTQSYFHLKVSNLREIYS